MYGVSYDQATDQQVNSAREAVIGDAMTALELITLQKGILTVTKKSNVILKLKKGEPIGCKVVLRKTNMYNFWFSNLYNFYCFLFGALLLCRVFYARLLCCRKPK